jgi:hypothetical protein
LPLKFGGRNMEMNRIYDLVWYRKKMVKLLGVKLGYSVVVL